MLGQARCAAHELPLSPQDLSLWDPVLLDLLTILEEDGEVTKSDGRWFYVGQDYPAQKVNLRTTGGTFLLRDRSAGNRLIGTMDRHTAFSEAYPGAVYLHQGTLTGQKNLMFLGGRQPTCAKWTWTITPWWDDKKAPKF